MSNIELTSSCAIDDEAEAPRSLRAWARMGGLLFASLALVSMTYSAEWKVAMVLTDPLAWMMVLAAIAPGLVAGYALGLRVQARR
jgi:hypothetical protein